MFSIMRHAHSILRRAYFSYPRCTYFIIAAVVSRLVTSR